MIQTIDEDYGPNNKILGAIRFYETIPEENKLDSYIIICDDDNKYDKDITKSYTESILENNINFIYTHFYSQKCRLKNESHIQGADTYLLIPEFFKITTYNQYKEYLDKTISECPESFYQDDYVILYYIHIYCKLLSKTVKKIHGYTEVCKINQLHLDQKVYDREKKTIEYFNKLL